MIAFVVVLVLLKTAERLGDVPGDRRFFRNYQCFSHALSDIYTLSLRTANRVQVGGTWLMRLDLSKDSFWRRAQGVCFGTRLVMRDPWKVKHRTGPGSGAFGCELKSRSRSPPNESGRG